MTSPNSDHLATDLEQCRPLIAWIMQQIEEAGAVTPAMTKRVTTQLGDRQQLRATVIDLALGTLQAQRLGKGREGWFFTPRMAEQSTHPLIAAYHASMFAGKQHVVEICTGAGLDAQALARVVRKVTTYEADPLIAQITQMNLRTEGIDNVTVVERAWTSQEQLPLDVDGIWADPSRRMSTGRRARSAMQYSPSIEEILAWATNHSSPLTTGIKIGPGDIVSDNIDAACSSEYIGFGRECRERILWLNTSKPYRSAHLCDLHVDLHNVLLEDPHNVLLADLHSVFLIEPHNAAIAAGLVNTVFHNAGVAAIDPKIAYGIGGKQPPPSPWYEIFEVVKIDTGVSERRIRERVIELGFNARTEIKKRGWDKDPEELRRKIDFPNTEHPGVIIITRRGDQHLTVYARRSTSAGRHGSP